MKRSATAIWHGSLIEGSGLLTTGSYVLNSLPFSFQTQSESATPGATSPQELLAAAHAGCLSVALSDALIEAGYTPERMKVAAEITLDNILVNGWTITSSHLVLVGKVPGIKAATFARIAAQAKANCPVSRVLKTNVTLDTNLV